MKTYKINSIELAKLIANVFNSDLAFSNRSGYNHYSIEGVNNIQQHIGWLMFSLMQENRDVVVFDTNKVGYEFSNNGKTMHYVDFSKGQLEVISKWSLIDVI